MFYFKILVGIASLAGKVYNKVPRSNRKERHVMNRKAYFNLLEESFPGMSINIKRCEELGYPYLSRPFLKEIGGEAVSHVGFIEYPVLIEGQWHKGGAFHAVCTKGAYRGQGFSSSTIQEALMWAEEKYEFVFLFTEIPWFYERFSFQIVPEYRFHLPCRQMKGSKALNSVSCSKDKGLFLSCFQSRSPVSKRLWVKDDGTISSFNTLIFSYPLFWSLYHSPSLNCMFSFELKDKTLHLYDVIASQMPTLDQILDHLPGAIEEIYFYFSPDLFTGEALPEHYLYDNGHLMVHGKWKQDKPFMIAPLSRC